MYMARKWSGFLPQNLSIKEEWDLLEACTLQTQFGDASPTTTGDAEEEDSRVRSEEDELFRFFQRVK